METVERPRPLFSKTLRPEGRLYFLDVYKARNGGLPYLSICENRRDREGGFHRVRLFLSPLAVSEMREALGEVDEFLRTVYTEQAQA